MMRRANLIWITLGVLWAAALALGVAGFAHHAQIHNLDADAWDAIYQTFQLIPMNSGAVVPPIPVELQLARFLMPLLTWTAAIQAGFSLFRKQLQNARLRSLRGHIIICGLSRKGWLLVQRFRECGEDVVVIEKDETNPWIEPCRALGAIFLQGDAGSPAMLQHARVDTARGLFAVCDDDGTNAEIAIHARDLVLARGGGPLNCLAHITDPQLCKLMREYAAGLEETPFNLELFSQFERGAREMLRAFPAWKDSAAGEKRRVPHIVLVGVGRMGEALAVEAGRTWWNEEFHKAGQRLQITLIDRDAASRLESLLIRYPCLSKACEIQALSCNVHSPAFERADFLLDEHGCVRADVVYICLDNAALGLNAGLVLHRRLGGNPSIPIVIRMVEESGLAALLGDASAQKQSLERLKTSRGLYAFPVLESTCTVDLLHSTPRDVLARAAHEEYRRDQMRLGVTESDNPSLVAWEALPADLQAANYRWIDRLQSHIAAAGYSITPLVDWDAPSMKLPDEIVEQMARDEHQWWRADRESQGWRYAAGKKDAAALTHPDLVDWEVLPEAEQEKNRLLVRQIPMFLGRAGFQLAKTAETA